MLNRKYVLCLMLSMILCILSSCKSEQITMIVPAGSPQLAQIYMQDNDAYDVTVVEGADPLAAAFGSRSYDIIVAPTNLGAKLYDAKPDYQLIATITWGSYYLISQSDIDEMETIEVIAFGRNQIPDAILQFSLEGFNRDYQVSYLDSMSAVVSAYTLDSSKVYLISEPALSLLDSIEKIESIVDLQLFYKELTGYDNFPQASVFINHEISDSKVKKIKNDFKNSIDKLNTEKEASAILALSLGINIDQKVIENSIAKSNIKYVDSQDAKEDIIFFLGLLKGFNPNFIGENLPEEHFYR